MNANVIIGTPGPQGASGPTGPAGAGGGVANLLPFVGPAASLPPAAQFDGYAALTTDQGLFLSSNGTWSLVLPILAGPYSFAGLPAAALYPFFLAITIDQGPVFSNGTLWTAITLNGPYSLVPGVFTASTLPAANQYSFRIAITSDLGPVFSDGANWLPLYNPTNANVGIANNSPLPITQTGVATTVTFVATQATAPGGTWTLVSTFSSSNTYSMNASTGVLSYTPSSAPAGGADTIAVQFNDPSGPTPQKIYSVPIQAGVLTPAATPTFSPVAGTYTAVQTVAIACSTSSSTIFYTTNGSTPTTSSAVYTAPISVAISQTVKAIATASGFTQSAVGSAAYVINLPTTTYKFNPGDYMESINFNSNTLNQTEINLLVSHGTGVKGYMANYHWAQMEATQGSYATLAAAVQADYNYLQSKVPGARFAVAIESDYGPSGGIVTSTFPSHVFNNQCVPNWILNASGGVLNVFNTVSYPTSSGATTAYQMTAQQNGQYGFGLSDYNGSSAYIIAASAFWDPGVNAAWMNFWKALAMVPLQWTTASGGDNNFYPLDQHPLVELIRNGNEVSYNFNQGPYKPAGSGTNACTNANFWNNYKAWANSSAAAFPHTMIGIDVTYGITGNGGSTDTASAFNTVNGWLSQSNLGGIKGLMLLTSDTFGANWSLNYANNVGAQASNSTQAFIGIQTATAESGSATLPVPTNPSLQGVMPIGGQVQTPDYSSRMYTTAAHNGTFYYYTAGGVQQIIQAANGTAAPSSVKYTMGATHRWWASDDDKSTGTAWATYIQPTFSTGTPVNTTRPSNLP